MHTGKIRSLNADKGFGFITPSTGGTDVFFHCSAVDAEFTELKLEQAVQYEHDPSAARPRAKQVLSGTKNPRTKHSPSKRSTLGSRPDKKSATTTNRRGTNRSGIHGGNRNNNRLGRSPGSTRPDSRPRTPRPEINYTFGYITKLPRKNPIGFISSDEGGPEYYFEPKDVCGNKTFRLLTVGDYVRFVARPNVENPKQPLAKMVEVVHKPINRQENHLPRHPKARGKKPTWKS
jgi:CspA family cold shock protein